MDLNTYQPLALRTAKMFDSTNMDLVHVALGLTSEHFELMDALQKRNYDGAFEELGDALWYCALGAHVLGFQLSSIQLQAGFYNWTEDAAMANFISHVKRRAIYGKEMNQAQVEQAIGDLHVIVANLVSRIHGINYISGKTVSLGDVLKANIDKLKLRYPDKYSDEAAEARADKGGLDARVS